MFGGIDRDTRNDRKRTIPEPLRPRRRAGNGATGKRTRTQWRSAVAREGLVDEGKQMRHGAARNSGRWPGAATCELLKSIGRGPWAQPHNISAELDALGAGVGPDELVNPSPDGEWLVMSTERFHAVVFEAERDGSEIYRSPAGGGPLQRVGTSFSDDGAPCVLPNGQIASVWFGNPDNAGGEAELKVMSADSMGHYVLLGAGAAPDANLGCGRRKQRETR